MKKLLVFAAMLLLSLPAAGKLTVRDTIDHRIYTRELGFYQKAERELSDPRFMLHDDANDVDFGIGGTVGAQASYTVHGALASYKFSPAKIDVPTYSSNAFMANPFNCELHAKVRAKLFGHKIISFIKIKTDDDLKISLGQAYISFDGFSIGIIPSFFSDLEAGVKSGGTVVPQPDKSQPLIGYTFRWKQFEAALSLEKAAFQLDAYKIKGVASNFQPMPDIAGHFKHYWDKGHVQLGVVVRNLSYWARDEETAQTGADGINAYTLGIGGSLSGNFKLSDRLKFSYVLAGGKGIARYLDIFSPLNIEVGLTNRVTSEGYAILDAQPIFNSSLMAQFWWTDFLSSSVILQYAHAFDMPGFTPSDSARNICFATANLFWYLNDSAYAGIEYMFGSRSEYANLSKCPSKPFGLAHRFALVLAYQF